MSVNNISDLQKDLASSVQKIFEYKLFEIIKEIKNLNYSDNLVYAGGCALNCLANSKIDLINKCTDIYIMPSASDRGLSLGAAAKATFNFSNSLKPVQNMYLGRSFSSRSIFQPF